MSQFKNRIPGSLPFTTSAGSDSGYCCSNAGDGSYVASTRYECFLKNGFFVQGNETNALNNCPKVQKGKCCLYNKTTRTYNSEVNNVPYCSCNVVNYSSYLTSYVDSASTCPTTKSSFAPETGACCYWSLDGSGYINKCETTSNYDVCASLHQGAAEGLKFAFYLDQSCNTDGGVIVCNAGRGLTNLEQESNPECIPNTDKDCFKEQNILGNCCTLLTDNTRECTVTTKQDCGGFWSYLGKVNPCIGSTLCSGVYFPEKSGTEYIPTTASLNTITNTGNPIQALPSEPALYQGGLYVGIFEPGSSINVAGSMVYGNIATGDALQYRARGTGPGTRNKKWILIAASEDTTINVSSILDPQKDSSFYDGFYTTNTKNTGYYSTIRQTKINGFSDWYIPSQDELAFFFNTISSSASISGFTPLDNYYYLTSTHYGVGSTNNLTTIGDRYFVYTQSAISGQYGKVILMPQDNLNCKVRLFRRIYLGT